MPSCTPSSCGTASSHSLTPKPAPSVIRRRADLLSERPAAMIHQQTDHPSPEVFGSGSRNTARTRQVGCDTLRLVLAALGDREGDPAQMICHSVFWCGRQTFVKGRQHRQLPSRQHGRFPKSSLPMPPLESDQELTEPDQLGLTNNHVPFKILNSVHAWFRDPGQQPRVRGVRSVACSAIGPVPAPSIRILGPKLSRCNDRDL